MHGSVFLYLVLFGNLYLIFRCFQLLLIILWVLLFHSTNKIRESEDILYMDNERRYNFLKGMEENRTKYNTIV
jgi:hypothetical protein